VADLAFSPRAVASLRRIEDFPRERNPAAAERVLADIRRTCDLLLDNPMIGTSIEGTRLRRQVTRRYRYRVIYGVAGGVVQIRYAMHPSRGDI
jgi:plasmid stabilization system protein ParE